LLRSPEMLRLPSCNDTAMSSFFIPGSSAFTTKLSLSSKTSKAGVQPLKRFEPRTNSANGASNKRSISSRRFESRPTVGNHELSGRCHLVRFIFDSFLLDFKVLSCSKQFQVD